MTSEDYIKLSEALQVQVSFVADRATEIIREIVEENADDDEYLWLGAVDYLWIRNRTMRIMYLSINGCGQIFYGTPNDCDKDELLEGFLSDLNHWDKIEIADYLVEHF